MTSPMTLADYLEKKKNTKSEIKNNRCYRCFRSKKICFCDELISFPTNTTFRILMHPKEAFKERVGTGRLTNICLKNCEIIIDKDFTNNAELKNLFNSNEYYPCILYPGKTSLNISEPNNKLEIPKDKKLLLLVIDGTWPEAKAMMRDSKILHQLPRISFNPEFVSQFKIKQQPSKFCLSTIESIYQLLLLFNKMGIENLKGEEEKLPEVLRKIVDIQIKCSMDPLLSNYRRGEFKKPEQRAPAKKWLKRKICYDEVNYLNQ